MRKTKELRIKITGVLLVAVIAATSAQGNFSLQKIYAAEFTVTESKAVLYSNDKTRVYKQPDINSGVVTVIAKDLPVDVTGITSNGFAFHSMAHTMCREMVWFPKTQVVLVLWLVQILWH